MLQFAVAIVFPNVDVKDIVTAAVKSEVHIIDKENYDPEKDYIAYSKSYEPYVNGSKILLLFIFPEGHYTLADTEDHLVEAAEKIKALQQTALN
ncbi:MAG: hypothetical protein EOP51_04050 [Sphingobacteriales bacterium]|nr:MAG: hypothetical protein EOP51_04050 [Sphingobacteriales bacterium]